MPTHASNANMTPSRRRLLQVTGAGLAVSLAGCLGDDDNSDDSENGDEDTDEVEEYDDPAEMTLAGDAAADFRDWLLPGYAEESDGAELLFQFENYAEAEPDSENTIGRTRELVSEDYGVSEAALQWGLGVSSEVPDTPGWIYTGDFDVDSVVEFLTQPEEVYELGPYEGYQIIGGTTNYAVSADTIIHHPSFEAFIEAEQGERERLEATDEDVRLALDIVPSGLRIGMSRRPSPEYLGVSATSFLDYNGLEATNRIRTLLFDTAENATLENARSVIESDEVEVSRFDKVERAGRVMMLHYGP